MLLTVIKHKLLCARRVFRILRYAFPINKYFASKAFYLPSVPALIYADEDCCSKAHKFYDDSETKKKTKRYCRRNVL